MSNDYSFVNPSSDNYSVINIVIEIFVDFFSSDVFDELSFWLKCWYKWLVEIYHIFKILYFMIKCRNFYTAVSNLNKNILPLVDISEGLSFYLDLSNLPHLLF